LKVRVLVQGYLRCSKCGNRDDAVERGGILDGVFCCTFMEPYGEWVEMEQEEWIQKHETFRSTIGWENDYEIHRRTIEGETEELRKQTVL